MLLEAIIVGGVLHVAFCSNIQSSLLSVSLFVLGCTVPETLLTAVTARPPASSCAGVCLCLIHSTPSSGRLCCWQWKSAIVLPEK